MVEGDMMVKAIQLISLNTSESLCLAALGSYKNTNQQNCERAIATEYFTISGVFVEVTECLDKNGNLLSVDGAIEGELFHGVSL